MMVNLIYIYDIIPTMCSTYTMNKTWSIYPDLKHLDEKDEFKSFPVSSVFLPDLSPSDIKCSRFSLDIVVDRIKRLVRDGCPIEWFIRLINSMMKIDAKITYDGFGNISVHVDTFYHMRRYIDEAIQKMIDQSFFTNLSLEDATEIISRLKLKDYLYCFEGHVSGVCLVVLGPNVHRLDKCYQPWYLFQQEVLKVNESRTIVMSSEQEERLINDNEEFRRSVEFRSMINKTRCQVVFKRNNNCIRIIRKVLEVEDLTTQLSKAKMELEEMVQLEEILELQKQIFP
jgi:hypothetical protein